jgi:polar amino acid transport system substrate-binding protein
MGIKDVELRKTTFPELLPGVAAGHWTMNTGLFVTPERCKTVAYANPIWALVDGMIVRASNPKRISSYASVAASDARLGVVKDTVQVGIAKAAGVPAERLIEFRTQEEAIAAIKEGRVDAFAATALGHGERPFEGRFWRIFVQQGQHRLRRPVQRRAGEIPRFGRASRHSRQIWLWT